jgi:hypothetical protein
MVFYCDLTPIVRAASGIECACNNLSVFMVRAADFAVSLIGQYFDLKAEQLENLCYVTMQHQSE